MCDAFERSPVRERSIASRRARWVPIVAENRFVTQSTRVSLVVGLRLGGKLVGRVPGVGV